MKTISRFYLNNFEDDFKQKIFNILIGHKKSYQTISQGEIFYPSFSLNLITIFDDKSHKKLKLPLEHFLKTIHNVDVDFWVIVLEKSKNKKIKWTDSKGKDLYDIANLMF